MYGVDAMYWDESAGVNGVYTKIIRAIYLVVFFFYFTKANNIYVRVYGLFFHVLYRLRGR